MKTVLERFNEKWSANLLTGCWEWTAGTFGNGYGLLRVERKNLLAHRISFEMAKGAIPNGYVLDHLCRNPGCVNPDHLEAVPQRINILRGNGPEATRRRRAQQTHCKHGHPFSGDNLAICQGKRVCRECSRNNALASYYRHHERNKVIGRDRKRLAYHSAAARTD